MSGRRALAIGVAAGSLACGTRSQIADRDDLRPLAGDGAAAGVTSAPAPGGVAEASGGTAGGPAEPGDPDACTTHCAVLAQATCGAVSLADVIDACATGCASRRGSCVPHLTRALACLAEDPDTTLQCPAPDDPRIACGPCDAELERVERHCAADALQCVAF